MAIDALAGALIGGLGDAGAVGAADLGVAAGADLGAAAATDVGLGALSTGAAGDLTATALAPDLTASIAGSGAAGLDAATADFGAFSPDLFAANSADVATGGFGTDLTAADTAGTFGGGATDLTGSTAGITGATAGEAGTGATIAGTPGTGVAGIAGDTTAIDSGFFGGTSDALTSGAGMGDFSTLGTDFGGTTPFTDPFSAEPAGGLPGSTPTSTFGGGIQTAGPADFGAPAAGQGGIGEGPIGSEPPTGPIVQSDTGVVDTGGGLGGDSSSFADRFNASFGGEQTPTAQQTISQDFSTLNQMTPSNPTFMNSPTGADLSSIMDTSPGAPSLDTSLTGVPQNITTGADFTGSQLNTMAATPLTEGGGTISPTGAITTTQEAFAPAAANPLPPATDVTAAPGSVPATPGTTGAPTVAGAPATGSSVPASPAAVANAGGGISPITALRAGTAGVNAITAGINLSNALNQPSYSALQPIMYPGSPMASTSAPYAGPYSGQTPLGEGGYPGTGGIAGGLAASRLTNGLVSGASPQQLAASGLISPQRATQLESTYTGITQAYARELGVSPQSLSPGIRQMIAAQALADNGLGGR